MFRRKGDRQGAPGRHSKEVSEITKAERALDEAKRGLEMAEERAGIAARLKEGWERVHQRNNLAHLFEDEWGRTK